MASYVLSHGYAAGFELVFMLNACLAAVAAIASFFMINHTELTRGDEEIFRAASALAALRDGDKTQTTSRWYSLLSEMMRWMRKGKVGLCGEPPPPEDLKDLFRY
ncbi:hypothetical protein OG21DRAFT_1266446 [Imleria badia]|nr:hypothetical protein OG21DRAFT_1266446 [Imleria badia]